MSNFDKKEFPLDYVITSYVR